MFELIENEKPFPAALAKGVIAVGNFDGVHRGHQAVIARTLEIAREEKRPALVLTFEPHPRTFFKSDTPVFRLTHVNEKTLLLCVLGVDGAVVMPFDRNLSSLTAEEFIRKILVERLQAGHVIAGYDFHFGKGRAGTPEFLREEGARQGFKVTLVSPEQDEGGAAVSSSRIRAALEAGDTALANALLGYRWFVTGEVMKGDGRGHALGFPTANMRLPSDCHLRHGVYAARARIGDTWFGAAVHYGRRVQFGGGEPFLEAYVLDFNGDLYGQSLRIEFDAFLRPEMTFADTAALVQQMHRDVEEARAAIAAVITTPQSELQAKLEEA